MPASEAAAEASVQPSRLTNCPDCQADLAVLRIIPGRAGAEYWTMRCTRCGGIHLDIVGAREVTQGSDDLRA
jgi:DNA-directed RNA polymerase subunit M/transcription elongation factor TFIIS